MSDVAVYVLVNRHTNRMLMEWRTPPWPPYDLWCFGSGVVEPMESSLQAAERELYEELGLTAMSTMTLPPVFNEYGRAFHAFIVDEWTGEVPLTNKDPDTDYPLGWFPVTMLPGCVNDVTRAIHALVVDTLTCRFVANGNRAVEIEAVA